MSDQDLIMVTKACTLGLISGAKLDHARCANRSCQCHCHDSTAYPKSWKVHPPSDPTGESQ